MLSDNAIGPFVFVGIIGLLALLAPWLLGIILVIWVAYKILYYF